MQLRPYQQELISSLRKSIKQGNKKVVLCAPTGAGKTIMFSYMVINHIQKGGKVLILTHRKELLIQTIKGLKNIDFDCIEAGANYDLSKSLHIGMVETINRRIKVLNSFINSRTMIIIDEAHLDNFTKLFQYINPSTIVIGATATPERKGIQSSMQLYYTDLIQQVDTPDLIELNYLKPAISYGLKIDTKGLKKSGDDYDTKQYYQDNKVFQGVVQNYKTKALNRKTIVFSSNVESSKQVCNEFTSNDFDAKHIDGTTPDKERANILKWFNDNPNAILCNCGVLTTGFDQPDVGCVILYRATTSLPLFLQMCGRGSRIADNKENFIILDFGNNIQRHGHWENRRVWSLVKKEKKSNKQEASGVKYCDGCDAILAPRVKHCPYCGLVFTKEIEKEKIVELHLLPKSEKFSLALKSSLREKVFLAKNKVVSSFWLLHNMTDINEAREFCNLMGYSKNFEYVNKERFKVFQ